CDAEVELQRHPVEQHRTRSVDGAVRAVVRGEIQCRFADQGQVADVDASRRDASSRIERASIGGNRVPGAAAAQGGVAVEERLLVDHDIHECRAAIKMNLAGGCWAGVEIVVTAEYTYVGLTADGPGHVRRAVFGNAQLTTENIYRACEIERAADVRDERNQKELQTCGNRIVCAAIVDTAKDIHCTAAHGGVVAGELEEIDRLV